MPFLSFEQATSIRLWRVCGCFVERIHRTQSHCELGVIFIHNACASGILAKALAKSSGTAGLNQSFVGSISNVTTLPAAAPEFFSRSSSILNQWLPLPSGSSAARKGEPLRLPSTNVIPRDGNLALALSGSLRTVQAPILNGLALKRITDILFSFYPKLTTVERRIFARQHSLVD